jgi:hypothetical protein
LIPSVGLIGIALLVIQASMFIGIPIGVLYKSPGRLIYPLEEVGEFKAAIFVEYIPPGALLLQIQLLVLKVELEIVQFPKLWSEKSS